MPALICSNPVRFDFGRNCVFNVRRANVALDNYESCQMKSDSTRKRIISALLCAVLAAPLAACRFGGGSSGGSQPAHFKPGFNLLSPEQDVNIGRQNAAQVEREMPLFNDPATQQYVSAVGARLAARAPGEKFPYQFKVINVREINAFALPGGFMYVNRGTIEAARNEAELASVMAHEIAHVALRHGTSQLSKQLVAEKGLQIAVSIIGGNGATLADQVLGAGASAGVSLLFLRFSRTMEKQADLSGAQIMASAGYDPRAMPAFFKVLEEQERRAGGGPPQLLSDHPAPGNRVAYLNEFIPSLKVAAQPVTDTQEFQNVRARLRGIPPARVGQLDRSDADTGASREPMARPPAPSPDARELRAPDGSYELAIPNNWEQITEGNEMIFAPRGAAAKVGEELHVTHGLFVGAVELPANVRDLRQATEAYLRAQLEGNAYLSVIGDARQTTLGGLPAIMTAVGGESPVTGREERDIICTALLPDGRLFYLVLIAPQDEAEAYKSAFERTVTSVRFRQ
jgi:beta-barrel assembly-enhancing protease